MEFNNFPPLNLELTLEQKFSIQNMKNQVGRLPREHLETLLLQAAEQLMVKQNVILDLMRGNNCDKQS